MTRRVLGLAAATALAGTALAGPAFAQDSVTIGWTGPLSGGAIAATFGVRWVFLVVAILLAVNLLWVWAKVPEVR